MNRTLVSATLATLLAATACSNAQNSETASATSSYRIAVCQGIPGGPKTELNIALDVARKDLREEIPLIAHRITISGVLEDKAISVSRDVSKVELVRERMPMGDTGVENAWTNYSFVIGGNDVLGISMEDRFPKSGSLGMNLAAEGIQMALGCTMENVQSVLAKLEVVKR